ncbi:ABC transporter ATP-binding protein [Hondaea fermentalgiana]|uniref:ABC transporter ATP-binding protein n=1 Tax=Hondaea fermentalgiana TaxID=2315210 RepID=A0A2R5FZ35_9STRA|nr:ABC transporter ATP-binding protein [Hondaea fermentalgiana]|eukprot:GBG23990.1 ABC transporter ATP-binding protein [Hondaea fermentalgiana]
MEGSATMQAQLEECFGTDSLASLTLEDVSDRDEEYAACLNASGLVSYEVEEDFYFSVPSEDSTWDDLYENAQDKVPQVNSSSPCGSDPDNVSAECCAGVSAALTCELSPNSKMSSDCKKMLDEVVFDTYKCSSEVEEYAAFIGVLGALVLTAIVSLTVLRHRAFGALLRKNVILWRQRFFATLASQVFALVLVGALAGVLLGLTSMETTYYDIELLGLTLAFTTPDENRKLIYQNLRPFGGLFLLITFTYPVANMTVSLVAEKQTRMKEALRISGMRDYMQMSTWLITFLLKFLPMIVGCAVLAHYGAVFPNENVPTLALFFFAFVFAMAGFAFLVTVFFGKTRPAAIASVCVSFLIFFSSFHFLNQDSIEAQRNGCYLAPVCLALVVNTMLDDASLGTGFARAASLFATNQLEDLIQIEEASRRLVLAGFLYLIAAWYLDKVVPQEFGVRERPDFVLRPLYFWAPRLWAMSRSACRWLSQTCSKASFREHSASTLADKEVFGREGPAESLSDSETASNADVVVIQVPTGEMSEVNRAYADASRVAIRNVSKEYRINGLRGKRKAVNDLSLSFEKDQVTVLLGPNGAGKSTLIKMLTGMVQPSGGDISVFGLSIRSDMQTIRGRLGWCPQHDILYPSLTVHQHLHLFSALRGKRLDKDATHDLLLELELSDKLHAKARTLSGGQRRKLCLAIALIGDTDIIVLDEMTAGVDPVSRRACWSVIQNNRVGRAILLTTHFLDEADVLGDKIAIIANGSLCCEGNSLELKRKYGDGYRLTVGLPKSPQERASMPASGVDALPSAPLGIANTAETVTPQRVTAVVHEEVAGATIVDQSASELDDGDGAANDAI